MAKLVKKWDPNLTHDKGSMEEFLKESNRSLASYNLEGDKLKAAEEGLANKVMLSDAAKGVSSEIALTNINERFEELPSSIPGERTHIVIDPNALNQKINNDTTLSHDEKVRYRRALQIVDKMQDNNFVISKTPEGRYWIESNEDGKRYYARNNIAQVAELLAFGKSGSKIDYGTNSQTTNTNQTTDNTTTTTEDITGDDSGILEYTPPELGTIMPTKDSDEFKLKSYDKSRIYALGVDLASTIAGYGTKATGIGYPIGAGIDIVGGIASTAINAWGDYKDPEVSMDDMWKGVGIGAGAQLLEGTTSVPVGMARSILKVAKPLRAALRYYANTNKITTALSGELTDTLDRAVNDPSSLGVEDFRNMYMMTQMVLGGVSTVHGRRLAKKDLVEGSTKVNLSERKDFIKASDTDKLSKNIKGKKGEISDLKGKLDERADNRFLKQKKEYDDAEANLKKQADADFKKSTQNLGGTQTSMRTTKEIDAEISAANNRIKEINDGVANKKGRFAGKLSQKEQKEIDSLNAKITNANNEKQLNTAGATRDKAYKNIESDKKKLVDKAQKDLNDQKKRLVERAKYSREQAYQKEFDAAEKAGQQKFEDEFATTRAQVQRDFGTQTSSSLVKKANRKVLGKDEADRQLKEAQKAQKDLVEADSKLGKAKEKAKKLQEKVDNNPNATKAEKADAAKANDEVKKLEARRDKWYNKWRKAAGEKGEKYIKGPTKRVIEEAIRLPSSYYRNLGLGPDVKIIDKGVLGETLTGNRYHEYNREEAEKRIKDIYGQETDLSKYNLNQLRAVLKTLEKNKAEADTRLIPKAQRGLAFIRRTLPSTTSKPAPASNLPSLTPRQEQAVQAFVNQTFLPDAFNQHIAHNQAMAQWSAADKVVKKVTPTANSDDEWWSNEAEERLAQIEADKKAAAEAEAARIAALNNQEGAGDANNFDLDGDGKPDLTETEAQKLARLQGIIDKNTSSTTTTNPALNTKSRNLLQLIRNIKPSDFGKKSRVLVDRFPIREVSAPVLESPRLQNMPGYRRGMQSLDKQVRVDTADPFQASAIKTKVFNDSLRNKLALIAKNAEYVNARQDARLQARNQNRAAYIQAQNQNIATRNQAEANYAAQLNAARAQAETENLKRKGRLMNSFQKGVTDYTDTVYREDIMKKYNELSGIKSIWDTEYAPRIKYLTENNVGDASVKIAELNADFAKKYKLTPDKVNTEMLNLKSAYSL